MTHELVKSSKQDFIFYPKTTAGRYGLYLALKTEHKKGVAFSTSIDRYKDTIGMEESFKIFKMQTSSTSVLLTEHA